jgi:hypothetical protein
MEGDQLQHKHALHLHGAGERHPVPAAPQPAAAQPAAGAAAALAALAARAAAGKPLWVAVASVLRLPTEPARLGRAHRAAHAPRLTR